jgi:urocanate hydratase
MSDEELFRFGDPGMGVVRHVDAGYERAEEVARQRGVRVPMQEGEAPA